MSETVYAIHAKILSSFLQELYAQGRNNAGVLFASIPNFTEFYSEDVNEGVECIRLLNEIIVDFDQILDDEKFRTIEKIKTVGSTYMAASGINPLESERDELAHLCDLVDFAIEMKNKLEDINVHSFNTFQLRIGNSKWDFNAPFLLCPGLSSAILHSFNIATFLAKNQSKN